MTAGNLNDCDPPTGSGSVAVATYSAYPSRVQEASGSMSFSATLPAAPINGNGLIALGFDSAAIPTLNTGWTLLSSQHFFTNVDVYGIIAYHPVGVGELAAQTPFTGSPTHGGCEIIEVAGAASTLANSLESLVWGAPPVSGNATTSLVAATANDNDLAISFTGWWGTAATYALTLSETAWTHQAAGSATGASSELVASQVAASKGATISATCTIGQAFYGMISALLILKPDPAKLVYSTTDPTINTTAVIALEAIPANSLVNIAAGGMRKADKTLNREAHAFVASAVAAGASAAPQFSGKITGLTLSGLGPAYLSSAGGLSLTPGAAPDMAQLVGLAVSTSEVAFTPWNSVRQD